MNWIAGMVFVSCALLVGGVILSGTGIAFQIDVEDAVGVIHQVQELSAAVEEEI